MSVSSAAIPSSSIITGSISSSIPTASAAISANNSSSIYSTITPSASITDSLTTTTTSSSAAATTSNGSVWDQITNNPTAINLQDNAKNPADIGSQFTICFVGGLLIFLAFCIFRTRHDELMTLLLPHYLIRSSFSSH
ncbi:hypothetical protein A0J61_03633 [Choanephora cucurbitarum]|uniref:Uncharacterized protein n=1 Tax=Choanephora cucurbitarum TaxID=101091 RepID=A0A1C7NH40_9FUNG|nr:hypothetical protein A0J61_03633 [Choanephora cucurbitarum]